MSACRAIVRYGVGVDNLDLDAALRRGIVISRVPDYGSEDVAFHAVTLIAALAQASAQAWKRAINWRSKSDVVDHPAPH